MENILIYSKKAMVAGFLAFAGPLLAQESPGHITVFSQTYLGQPSGLNLNGDTIGDTAPKALIEQAPEELLKAGLTSRVQLRQKNYDGLSLTGDHRIESVSYGFDIDEIPVCDLEVKIHRTLDGLTTVMGEIPMASEDLPPFSEGEWADADAIHKIVSETLLVASLGTDYRIDSKDKCIWSNGSKPVWKMVVEVSGLNYEMIADDSKVYRFDAKHFHATEVKAKATVFTANRLEGKPEATALRSMDTTGLLSNKYFQVCLPSNATRFFCNPNEGQALYPFALAKDLNFTYDPINQSNEFIQASIFAHSNTALQWLELHGYKSFGTTPIKLLAHAVIQGDINNAMYQPATSSAGPMILVADGDNNILQNLGTDADVVSHELGHHVLFNTVTQITKDSEALVIHEGLSDYFTFARTGNACLGESVCTSTSIGLQVCEKPKKCLRSAENNYTFGDPSLPTAPHLRGQFVSGMLWDLHAADKIPQDDVTTLILKGVNLLVANSGYKHVVVSMLLVDHTDFGGKYCSTILARAGIRGLGKMLADVSCDSIANSKSSDASTEISLPKQKADSLATGPGKKASAKGCAVIGASANAAGAGSLLVILALPLTLVLVRRPKS